MGSNSGVIFRETSATNTAYKQPDIMRHIEVLDMSVI